MIDRRISSRDLALGACMVLLFAKNASSQQPRSHSKGPKTNRAKPKPINTAKPNKQSLKARPSGSAKPDKAAKPIPTMRGAKPDTASPAKRQARLPIMVVTATRRAADSNKIPQSMSIATAAEIAKRMPLQPIEALQDEPGVFIQQTGAGGGAPIVRGLIGNRVLYLVDGIRINSGRLFGGPNAFFNQVDIGSLGQVEVLRGPGAVQYGSDAIGGVFHVRTRSLNLFPKAALYGGTISTRYRSVDRSRVGALNLFAAQESFNVSLGGSYTSAENYQGGDNQGSIRSSSFRSRGLTGKTQVRIAPGHILTAAFLQSDRSDVGRHDQSARNQPSGIPRFSAPREVRRIVYLRDHIETNGLFSEIEPYLYHQGVVRESTSVSESGAQLRQDLRSRREQIFGLGLQGVTEISNTLRLTLGFDMRSEKFDDRNTRVTLDKASGAITRVPRAGGQPNGLYDAEDVYALLNYQPNWRLRIQLGGRFESTHINASPEPLDVSPGFTEQDLNLDKRYQAITWSGGVLYWFTEELGLKGTLATGFRAPTYSDTLSRGAFTFGVNQPSPDVGPETSFSYDIGPRYDSDRLRLSATWWQTFVQDQLVSQAVGGFVDLDGNGTEDPGEAAFQKKNRGSSRLYGIETAGALSLLGPVSFFDLCEVYGNFTWTYGQDLENGAPQRFIPPANGVAGLRFGDSQVTTGRGWEIDVFARMARKQDRVTSRDKRDTARATDPSLRFPSGSNPPLRRDFSVPGYTTFHLRVSGKLSKRATIYLSGDNLGNKKYRRAYSRQDAPGFSISVGGEVSF